MCSCTSSPSPSIIPQAWYTTRQAADRAGVHQKTVQFWIARKILPAYALPGGGRRKTWRVKPEDLERILVKSDLL